MSLPSVLNVLKVLVSIAAIGATAFAVHAWPVAVEGVRVDTGPVTAPVLGIGVLESAREVRLSFEASGRITALTVDEGEPVAEGDRLGTLDVDDAVRELHVSRATVAAAAADLERARAELERGRLAATLAAAERARAEVLFAGGDLPAAARDAAVERDASARATVRSLEAAVGRAVSGGDAARGGARIREANVTDGVLRSPLTGLVVRREVEVGQWVGAGTPAFTVVADAAFEVRAWVDETALARLAVGQRVALAFRSDGERTYEGRVARIGREVDRQTHELKVDVAVLELPHNFALGQRADAWIEVASRDEAVRVPRGWCDTTCLVAEDGRARQREVVPGLVGRETVEILSGLSPGDVVLRPGSVSPGRRVRVTEGP